MVAWRSVCTSLKSLSLWASVWKTDGISDSESPCSFRRHCSRPLRLVPRRCSTECESPLRSSTTAPVSRFSTVVRLRLVLSRRGLKIEADTL